MESGEGARVEAVVISHCPAVFPEPAETGGGEKRNYENGYGNGPEMKVMIFPVKYDKYR